MKKSVIFTIAILVLLMPAMLSAQGIYPSKAQATRKAMCKESMELSEEQQAKMAELKFEQEIASIKLGAELKILKLEMKQEMSKDDPSAKELERIVSKISAVKEKLLQQHVDHVLRMKKILGPENWKLYKKCCGGMRHGCGMSGHGCMGMCGCSCCGSGHGGFMGKCGSGCGGTDKHIWIEKGGAGCRGMGDMGGSCIIKMDCSDVCGGEKTVDIHKMIKSCHPGEVKKIKAYIEGEDDGKKIKHHRIMIEKEE